MHDDKSIGIGLAMAIGAWGLSVLALIAMWVSGDLRAGITGLSLIGVAVTCHVRSFLIEQSAMWRNAFQLGQDSVTPGPWGRVR